MPAGDRLRSSPRNKRPAAPSRSTGDGGKIMTTSDQYMTPSGQYQWEYSRPLFWILVGAGYVAAAFALYFMFNNAVLHS
jgi:hypothetical protein